jgi:hypothetical protein
MPCATISNRPYRANPRNGLFFVFCVKSLALLFRKYIMSELNKTTKGNEMSKANMTKMDWLNQAADSVVDKMKFQMVELGKSKDDAIRAVKEQTCAGSAAWELALSKLA